jgi:hypothetical protein
MNRIGRRYGRTQSNASVGIENGSHTKTPTASEIPADKDMKEEKDDKKADNTSTPTIEH